MIDNWGHWCHWSHSRYQGQGSLARGTHSMFASPVHPGAHPHTASWPRAWLTSPDNVSCLMSSLTSQFALYPQAPEQGSLQCPALQVFHSGQSRSWSQWPGPRGPAWWHSLWKWELVLDCFPSKGSCVGGSVCFYCLYRSLISRPRTSGLSKCHKRFLRQLLAAGRWRRRYY